MVVSTFGNSCHPYLLVLLREKQKSFSFWKPRHWTDPLQGYCLSSKGTLPRTQRFLWAPCHLPPQADQTLRGLPQRRLPGLCFHRFLVQISQGGLLCQLGGTTGPGRFWIQTSDFVRFGGVRATTDRRGTTASVVDWPPSIKIWRYRWVENWLLPFFLVGPTLANLETMWLIAPLCCFLLFHSSLLTFLHEIRLLSRGRWFFGFCWHNWTVVC